MNSVRVAFTALSLWAFGADLARAQFYQDPAVLADRLEQVEEELRTLKAQMRNGQTGEAVAGAPEAAPIPASPVRLDDLEQSLRRLTGQVEELSFQVRRMQEQYETAQRDTQYRLGALEGGAPSALPSAAAPVGPAPAEAAPTMVLRPGAPAAKGGAPGPGVLGTLPADSASAATAGTPDEKYQAALNTLSKQQYPEAQDAFRAFVAAYPQHERASHSQFFAADIDFVLKNYANAAQGFATLLKTYPKAPRAPEAMLKLGLSLAQAGDKANGCVTLAALRQKYPEANAQLFNRAAQARKQFACK